MNLPELQELARKAIEEGMATPKTLGNKIAEFFSFAYSQYDELESDAQQYVDDLSEKFMGLIEENLAHAPDTPQRRSLLRLAAGARGKHFREESLLKAISGPAVSKYRIVPAAQPVFTEVMQATLDFLHDVTRRTRHGAADFSVLALCFLAVEELNVGFYLAQRTYTTQALAHDRSVSEILNLIDLFKREPKWAETWASAPTQVLLTELSPAAVRKKLGKPRFDPIFSYLSEFGTHATFRNIQGRTSRKDSSRPGNLHVSMWVAGVAREDSVVLANSFTIMAAVSLLLTVGKTYETELNAQEALERLSRAINASVAFLENEFTTWAKGAGLDTDQMLELLRSKPV
jgi:hypothetical protein